MDRGYDYEDIVDEHEPPEVIFDQITDDYFGLPAHRTTADRVSSYVQFLYDSGFTRGEQLYREVNAKGIYEFLVMKNIMWIAMSVIEALNGLKKNVQRINLGL